MIREYSDPKIEITSDSEILDFYQNEIKQKKVRHGRLWVGDETYYNSINHLMPNHYLQIPNRKVKRYWPRQKQNTLDLDQAVQLSCAFIQGIMKAVTNRYSVMMAVTAGMDSRTLLANSKSVKDKIYFFINKESPLTDNHPDIYIPKMIMNKINISFHIHPIEENVDENFKTICLNNTFMSTDLIIPTIYNVYFKQHSEKMNILGVAEIGRSYYGDAPKWINGYFLARCLKYKRSRYAVEQCEKWLEKNNHIAINNGINILTLFYWEEVLGNWGPVANSESDIAIEEFDPYNSHYLYETMLSVDDKYTKYGGYNILFKEMIKKVWPELLDFPINPPYSRRGYIKTLLKKIGIEKYIKNIVYRLDERKYYHYLKRF